MAIEFRGVEFPPLTELNAAAPDGAIIGILGEKGSGVAELLRLAAGLEKPRQGDVAAGPTRRLLGPAEVMNLAPVDVLALEFALSQQDALVRARSFIGLERLRKTGTTILMASPEEDLLARLCDEIWWINQGRLAARGDPREILEKYRRYVAEQVRSWGATIPPRLTPSFRRGNGQAEILSIDTLGAGGQPTIVWTSGEAAAVRLAVQFRDAVPDPVLGILIRTRIGFEVYGTNTQLEGVAFGPCAPGEVVNVVFSFRCSLCPQSYVITAACHDPDGTAHDWIDDAVAVTVADSRFTAGVANLRAKVTIEKSARA